MSPIWVGLPGSDYIALLAPVDQVSVSVRAEEIRRRVFASKLELGIHLTPNQALQLRSVENATRLAPWIDLLATLGGSTVGRLHRGHT